MKDAGTHNARKPRAPMKRLELEWAAEMVGDYTGRDASRDRVKAPGFDNMPQLFCVRTAWQGREAYELGNGLIRLLTLTGGGHVAVFRFERSSGLPDLNPLWVPPWRTIDSDRYREALHAPRYGLPLEGKLLSGLAGHNICLDYFGSPSPEEVKQGLSQHGEAPNSRWRKTNSQVRSQRAELTLTVNLPIAGTSVDAHDQPAS